MFIVTFENYNSYYSQDGVEKLKKILEKNDLLVEVVKTDRDEIMREMGVKERGSLIGGLKRYPQEQAKEILSMIFRGAVTGVFAAREKEMLAEVHVAIVDSSFLIPVLFALFPKYSGINTKVLEQRNFLSLAQKANSMVDMHLMVGGGKSPRPSWEITKYLEAGVKAGSLEEAAKIIIEQSAAKAYRNLINLAKALGKKRMIK